MNNLKGVIIRCPCGQRCKGTGRGRFGYVRIPACFLSYSGKKMPLELKSNLRSETEGGFLINLFMAVIVAAQPKMDEILNGEYKIFQCPGCGCEVYFNLWNDANGDRKCKRVHDTAKC